jgi:hypothetical protein
MIRYKKIPIMLLILTFITLSLPTKVSTAREIGAGDLPYVTVTVNGFSRSVMVGDVVTKGSPTLQGYCEFPEIAVNYSAPSSINYADIEFTIEKDCDLVVVSIIESTQPKTPEPPDIDGSLTTPVSQPVSNESRDIEIDGITALFLGWAQIDFKEQVGIPVTKTRSEMSYQDNGVQVWDGARENAFCWWLSGTGWYQISCTESHSYGGPGSVWLQVWGEYDHPLHIWHKTSAKFKAVPGSWVKTCTFEGTIPPFWSYTCAGGRN